ncbi:hypothetical protein PGB90_000003 [Kerria lacca]
MFIQIFFILITIGAIKSAPTPSPEPHPIPVAEPAPKPGLTPVVYTQPVAVSYNAFSSVQTHPSASFAVVKNAPAAVVPAVQALPTIYTLQTQAAPAIGYAINYPYVVV